MFALDENFPNTLSREILLPSMVEMYKTKSNHWRGQWPEYWNDDKDEIESFQVE